MERELIVHCVTDENGKEMWFRLKPARQDPANSPIYLKKQTEANRISSTHLLLNSSFMPLIF